MKSEDTNVGHLEEEARKRKEKLERMKNKRNNEMKESEKNANDSHIVLPKPHFRSYIPNDETLKEKALPKAKPESVDQQIEDQLTEAKEQPVIDEVDLMSLAPRKVDWDLKRNLHKKLDKLEKRTQRAIAELIRDRLREASETADLAVATQDLESTKTADDSDED